MRGAAQLGEPGCGASRGARMTVDRRPSALPTLQTLADRLALVLGEHMACDDEMHLTYNAIQPGWQHGAGRDGWRTRPDHTQLFFEHSVLLVLRPPIVDD